MNEKYRRGAPSFLPSTAVLELTYKCNHNCIFCSCPWFAENNGFDLKKELDIDSWKNIITKLCKMGVCNIAFTGGEPLLKNGISKLIKYAAQSNSIHIETKNKELVKEIAPPRLFLLSNGKAMNHEILKLCKKYNINLSMSMPGFTTFDEHTKGGDTLNVLEWFKIAKNTGVKTTVGITVTKKNISEIYKTISAAMLAGADTLLLNRFLPGGRGIKYQNELCLNDKEILDMLDTAESILKLSNRYGSVGTELPKCLIKNKQYKHLKVGTRCSAAKDFFIIGPSGYIRVCNHSPVRLNHVDNIEELKNNEYWKSFVFKEYLPKKCFGCRDSLNCDGGCREAAHISGGRIDSPDPLIGISKIKINQDIK